MVRVAGWVPGLSEVWMIAVYPVSMVRPTLPVLRRLLQSPFWRSGMPSHSSWNPHTLALLLTSAFAAQIHTARSGFSPAEGERAIPGGARRLRFNYLVAGGFTPRLPSARRYCCIFIDGSSRVSVQKSPRDIPQPLVMLTPYSSSACVRDACGLQQHPQPGRHVRFTFPVTHTHAFQFDYTGVVAGWHRETPMLPQRWRLTFFYPVTGCLEQLHCLEMPFHRSFSPSTRRIVAAACP